MDKLDIIIRHCKTYGMCLAFEDGKKVEYTLEDGELKKKISNELAETCLSAPFSTAEAFASFPR